MKLFDIVKGTNKGVFNDGSILIICTDNWFEVYFQVNGEDDYDHAGSWSTENYLVDTNCLLEGAKELAKDINSDKVEL